MSHSRFKIRASDLIAKLLDHYGEWQFVQISRCYFIASREEQQMRLRTIMELSVLLDGIKKKDIFSTGLGEGAIEAVIQGDWKHAVSYADMLTFEDDGSEIREKYEPIWREFVLTLRAACAFGMRNPNEQGIPS